MRSRHKWARWLLPEPAGPWRTSARAGHWGQRSIQPRAAALHSDPRKSARPNAGPHVYLNLALAYIDKIPTVGAISRIAIGNKATKAATRSIELQPSEVAYAVRGMVNLRFEKGFFHRTPQGVADLEEARRLSATHPRSPYVARNYIALGDGYWRLKNPTKAREIWREGSGAFPADPQLRQRLTSPDNVVTDTINKTLDAAARVDTSLKEVFQD